MSTLPQELSSLLTGENAAFVDQLYSSWCEDPGTVSEDWQEIFSTLESNGSTGVVSPAPDRRSIFHGSGHGDNVRAEGDADAIAMRQARVSQLIRAYRVRGHCEADIDPLGQQNRTPHPELSL